MVLVTLGEVAVALLSLLDETATVLFQTVAPLTHPVRRRVLEALVERGVLNRGEMAEVLADEEAEIERLEISLHHNHLPKLDDEGFVEYDLRSGDVALWTDSETVRAALESR